MNMVCLGVNVNLVVIVGKDGFGDYILICLKEVKVSVEYILEFFEKFIMVIFVNRIVNILEFVVFRGVDILINEF